MSALARAERSGMVSRYRANLRTAQPVPWRSGVSNRIDRRMDEGLSAVEIAHELDVPRWVVVERFAARAEVA